MLVKRSIVETWYQRDSWVYRNFEFLFKNPLWNKRVPAGFSVCPYFWLSLFSLFALRPLVFTLTKVIAPLVLLGGLPLKALDAWIGKKVVGEKAYSRGMGIGLAIVGLIATALLGIVGVYLVDIYLSVITVAGGALAWWLAWSGIATAATVGYYEHKHRDRPDRCKAKIWLVVWLAAAIVIGIGSNPIGFLGFLKACGAHVWTAVSSIGWALGVAVSWTAQHLWLLAKFTGAFVWKAICFAPFPALYLPWWAYLLGLAWLMARVGDRVLQSVDAKGPVEAPRNRDEQALQREINRSSWKQLLRAAYQQSGLQEMVADSMENALVCNPAIRAKFKIETWDWKQVPAVLRFEVHDVLNIFIENRYGQLLDLLQHHRPVTTFWAWSQMSTALKRPAKLAVIYDQFIQPVFDQLPEAETSMLSTWWSMHAITPEVHGHEIEPAVNRWFDQVTEATATRVRALHDCYVASAREEERRRQALWNARQTSWSTRVCKRVTETTWAWLVAVGCGIKHSWFQLKVFVVYLWELLKARKQGACPYIMFKD